MGDSRAPTTRAEVRAHFDAFLVPGSEGDHPFYAALVASTHESSTLVDLVLQAPEPQRRPVLILAAIHDLALRDPSGPLAPWYPTAAWLHALDDDLDAPPATPPAIADPPDGGPDAVERACRDHHDEIVALIASRATQTNEVGRNGVLAAAQLLTTTQGRPTALIDLGCSAGLNLLVDEYRIELGPSTVVGDPASDVVIHTESRLGTAPRGPLILGPRCGIDLAPPDLTDDDDARWLLACQWPDDLPRFERSRRAIRHWRQRSDHPVLLTGDLVDRLSDAVALIGDEHHVVIQHSWVAAYLTTEEQASLASAIRTLGNARPISWIYLEHPREVPGLGPPRTAGTRIRGSSYLVIEEPPHEPRVVAQCHPHGTWSAWEDYVGSAGPNGT